MPAVDDRGASLCPHPDCVLCFPTDSDPVQLSMGDVLFHVMACEGG